MPFLQAGSNTGIAYAYEDDDVMQQVLLIHILSTLLVFTIVSFKWQSIASVISPIRHTGQLLYAINHWYSARNHLYK